MILLRPLSRTVNRQIRPLVSLNGSTGLRGFPTTRRADQEIILLLRKFVAFLKQEPKRENILGYVNRELDNTLQTVRSSHYVYEKVIAFFINRKYAQEAVHLHQRMHESGLMSSNALDAKMLAIALAVPHESPQPLILRLTPIFTDPAYTDKHFSGLLKTMTKYGVDQNIICTLVEAFIATRCPNYIIRPEFLAPLLSARVRSGDVEMALDVLDQFSGANQRLNRAARASLHAPYVQVLAALRDTRTWDTASVNRVLDLMKIQGLSPNLSTINILLSREVRLGNTQAAIGLFSMLQEMRITHKVSPDSFTFGTMFLLYRTRRPRAVRRHHRNDSPFPPRALYHNFMLAVKPKGNAERFVPSSTLMNVILRAFIRQRDYAGAFVVLSSYSLFSVPLDHRTYYCVVKHVVRRIWLEVTKQHRGAIGWSIMFLGVPDYRHVELNEDLVRNLLAFISQDAFHLVSPLYASRRHVPSTNANHRYKLPSMEMMESVFLPDPQDFYYSPVPLKRILRRAILSKLRMVDPNAGPAEVSKAIANAKVDMLPKIPQRKRISVSMNSRREILRRTNT